MLGAGWELHQSKMATSTSTMAWEHQKEVYDRLCHQSVTVDPGTKRPRGVKC